MLIPTPAVQAVDTPETRLRLGELDAMRGLAALAVVLFHYTVRYDALYGFDNQPLLAIPWGAYGVDFFFAISGFVILMTLQRCRNATDFLVSRFSRLYPAYWACLLLSFCVVSLSSLPGRESSFLEASINLTMVQHLLHVKHVDAVYWSLQVELIFYAWMLLFFMAGQLGRIRVLVVAWLAIAFGVGTTCSLLHREAPGLPSELLLLPFISMFSIGIIAFEAMTRGRLNMNDASVALLAVGTSAFWGGWGSALVCAITALVFGLFVEHRLRWLCWKPLMMLGGISFTLYLIHQNIGYVVMRHAQHLGISGSAAVIAALGISLSLATLVTRGVERPAMSALRNLYRRKGKPTRQVST